MKISREARNIYQFKDFKFSEKGNVVFDGDVYKVRLFVQKLNQKRDLITFPELAIKIGQFNGMAISFELYEYLLDLYKSEVKEPKIFEELYDYLIEKVGKDEIENATKELVKEFPPERVYTKQVSIDEFLEEKSGDSVNKVSLLNELINLWLANTNPSFSSYLELFDDETLEKKSVYNEILNEVKNFFESKPKFGPKSQNLIDMLKEPTLKYPYSIREQLEYMSEHWGDILGKYLSRVLIALDLIREEELFRGLGPGDSKAYEYDMLEFENYTPDKEWMPNVIMIAKNIYVWLDQLSKKYNHGITKLYDIPNEELDLLRNWGFNTIWLIGVWERSQASKTIKRWCGNPEAEASAYSLYDYQIAYDLGGYDAYKNLKDRAWARGIRLASDMVPNHTGIVSKWLMEHPDWYISLPYPPFPSYSYSGENLSGNNNIGIYLEDKYFSRTDAAVAFKHVSFQTGETRYIYHGNDGTSFPWNDTAQLNYLNPDVRETVIQTILDVSKMFPIIRFDAAMTLTRKHFQRLWFPEPGTGGAIPSRAEHGIPREDFFKAMPTEFWREVVDRINKENPDTLLLAEAFWLLEGYFVRTLGMHRVYNSAFMNMLRDEDNAKYRAVMKNTLEFDPKILKRFVNFMNNPDEQTAIKQFGDGDKYFGICTMMVTMPGLPMFGHGQIEGFHEKYGMEYRKAYWNEEINWGFLHHHENTIFSIMKKRYIFTDVKNFLLYDFWTGNYVNEDVFAYSNRFLNDKALVVYHNKFAETKGFIRTSVGFSILEGDEKRLIQKNLAEGLLLPKEGYCIFKDYITGLEYLRRNKELNENGLYLELHAYQAFVFMDLRIVQDNEFFHYSQLYDLLGGKGVYNLNETLQEMIYQPLNEPFREIAKPDVYINLINVNSREKVLKIISSNLNQFLKEVRRYSASNRDITEIEKDIINELNIVLTITDSIEHLQLSPKLKKFIDNMIPTTAFEIGILISWVFIHLLGKVVSDQNYNLRSRSWMDEWLLSKYVQLTLQKLSTKKKDDPMEAISLIKIMINHQNFCQVNDFEMNDNNIVLRSLLSDPEIQSYLQFNRYQNILWFSAEAFLEFSRWLSLIMIIKSFAKNQDNPHKPIEKWMNIIFTWIEAARESDYQVEKLIDLLSNK